MRIKLIAAIAIAAALGTPVVAPAATRIDDPVKFVKTLYVKIADANKASDDAMPDDIYTPRLAALFALEQKDAGGEVGRLDVNFWTNSQDWQLTDIKVTGTLVEGVKDLEIVTAKFKNTGRPQKMQFYFEKTKAGWKLDDACAMTDETWTLSLLLKYGFDDGK